MREQKTVISTPRHIGLIKKLVLLTASAVVSRVGLTVLTLSIIGLISRFFFNVAQGLVNAGSINEDVFEKFGDGVAIRLIAVGVLLAERHEILVFAGRHNEDDGPDQFSRATRSYGAVYLAFGLVLEVLLEQTKIPFFPSSGSRVGLVIAALTILIMVASLLASISLLHDAWQTKSKNADKSSEVRR